MRALEFRLNGKRLCVAAPGDKGLVVNSVVLMADGPSDKVGHVRVGGVRDEKHLEWLHRSLSLGDVVEIRLINTAESDPPASIEPITDDQRERLRIASGENSA